jgi:CRISPR-associated protein Cmr4
MGSTYRYVTSIGLLRRLQRDLEFVGQNWLAPNPTIGDDDVGIPRGAAKVYLEEFPFNPVQCQLNPIAGLPAGDHAAVDSRLAILNDNTFDYFARHGLFVRQRNALDGETKTVKDTALWSEESLPPDTLMYFVLMPRLPDMAADLGQLVDTLRVSCRGYFQVGGNETVGEGWFKMLSLPAAAAAPEVSPQPQEIGAMSP